MKDISYISVKLLAIYFLVEFISEGIPQIIGVFSSRPVIETKIILGLVAALLIKLLISLYLWNYAEKISKLITSNIEEGVLKNKDYKTLQIIAFSVVGVILIAISVPDFVQYFIEYLSIPGRPIFNILPKLIAKLAETFIGIWLLLGSESIVQKISRISC